MIFVDKIHLGKRITDENGFVSVPAVITRVGVQQYGVEELRNDPTLAPHLDGKSGLVNVFRPPDVVFNPLTMDSFKNIPVTVQHPNGFVNTSSAKYLVVGHVGDDVVKMDTERLGTTIHLHDEEGISVSKGSQTSAGYKCDIIHESGEHEGVKYEFKFDGAMVANHLALVPAARCGDDCKVLDNEEKEMDEKGIKKLVSDTVSSVVEDKLSKLKDTVAQAVTDAVKVQAEEAKKLADAEKLKQDKADEAKKLAEAEAEKGKKTDAVRIALHAKLLPILDKEYDASKTDKELLGLALKDTVKDADKKSTEYLADKLDELIETRKDAINFSDAELGDAPEIVMATRR
jgi:hypothetical protein